MTLVTIIDKYLHLKSSYRVTKHYVVHLATKEIADVFDEIIFTGRAHFRIGGHVDKYCGIWIEENAQGNAIETRNLSFMNILVSHCYCFLVCVILVLKLLICMP